MPGKGGRRLVIDADVACSTGETEHPVSSACRQVLDAVARFRPRGVMTPELHAHLHGAELAAALSALYRRRPADAGAGGGPGDGQSRSAGD